MKFDSCAAQFASYSKEHEINTESLFNISLYYNVNLQSCKGRSIILLTFKKCCKHALNGLSVQP
jgi:hypothetical protein